MCSHWGLKSWFSGIPEYITNVYCTCMANNKNNNIDGAYKSGENTFDCFCSIITNDSCPCCNCISNAIAGTICLPFAIVTHLFCLPIMCCYCNKHSGMMLIVVINLILKKLMRIPIQIRMAIKRKLSRQNLLNLIIPLRHIIIHLPILVRHHMQIDWVDPEH